MAVHQEPCEICERLAQCRAGTHPGLIAELDTGYAVLGDSQQFRGYCLLLAKAPVTELDELAPTERLRLLEEMAQLAEAVRRATGAHKINYEALGNLVHHLHWHIFPRRLSDTDPTAPVWGQMHPAGSPAAAACRFDPQRDAGLKRDIAGALRAVRAGAGVGTRSERATTGGVRTA
ncbi:MAG TPA: HIT family protein [Phycisphaerales bacterium]|nr:HIT family protein [Phycisphaerales bacterium]